MADALISPSVGASFYAISGITIIYSARKLKQEGNEKIIPLMGVLGAFIFAAQMINFTIPGTGSSGHLGGGMILAILLGPYAGFLTLASVLTIQALFFGDGGLLALGCNIFNLAFWSCFVTYPLIYRKIVKQDSRPSRITLGTLVSVLVAMQFGPFSVVIQTLLSGISDLPFKSFVLLIQPIHLAIGVVEGFVTAAFIAFVKKARPEILEATARLKPLARISFRNILVAVGVITLLTGGIFSWFASTHPDGLEWSTERITRKSEVSEPVEGITRFLGVIQEKTAFLPDYEFKSDEKPFFLGSHPEI
jgi:cobalt/nickel transport system permease protein